MNSGLFFSPPRDAKNHRHAVRLEGKFPLDALGNRLVVRHTQFPPFKKGHDMHQYAPAYRIQAAFLGMAAICCTASSPARAAAPYQPDTTYAVGSIVLGADGNDYRSISQAKDIPPTTSDGKHWQLLVVRRVTVLDVPGRFKSIADALMFLDGATINDSARVIIEIAAGTYRQKDPVILNHREGGRITVRGGTRTPQETVLQFLTGDGLIVSDSHAINLERLTVESIASSAKGTGLTVTDRSLAHVADCRFVNFQSGVSANSTSEISAMSTDVISRWDGSGFRSTAGSNGRLVNCRASSTSNENTGEGFLAFNSGSLSCTGCAAEGWHYGFKAHTTSGLHLLRCSAEGNLVGISSWWSSAITATSCSMTRNTNSGIGVFSATAQISDCRISSSRDSGCFVHGSSFLALTDEPTTITACPVGIRSVFGGRAQQFVPVQFQRINTPTLEEKPAQRFNQ